MEGQGTGFVDKETDTSEIYNEFQTPELSPVVSPDETLFQFPDEPQDQTFARSYSKEDSFYIAERSDSVPSTIPRDQDYSIKDVTIDHGGEAPRKSGGCLEMWNNWFVFSFCNSYNKREDEKPVYLDWFICSALALVFCLPAGIVAVFESYQTYRAVQKGDIESAKKTITIVKICVIIALMTGIIIPPVVGVLIYHLG
ncbi:uncharacterized protein [Ptychodera flava]|uniref:uncharacterized protein n=1 Tax=Ptychodera flava TaxID=63121 RepID=UPI00396A9952